MSMNVHEFLIYDIKIFKEVQSHSFVEFVYQNERWCPHMAFCNLHIDCIYIKDSWSFFTIAHEFICENVFFNQIWQNETKWGFSCVEPNILPISGYFKLQILPSQTTF